MKVFVISLKNAAERRAAGSRQLDAAGVRFRFFDAAEGAESLNTCFTGIDRRLYRLNTLREPLAAEIGCYASHLGLWKKCVELQESILVLEDDFHLEEGFAGALPTIHELADQYGFVRLERFHRWRKRAKNHLAPATLQIVNRDEVQLHYVSDVPLCATAYALNPEAARSLINASAKLIAPVDKFLQKKWIHGVPIFALSPTLVKVSALASDSTIGTRQRKSRNPALMVSRIFYKWSGELQRVRFDRKQLHRLRNSEGLEQSV
ncbi:MAG: glycosyltransferase family 25 protein [Woeseiaceae bacterium]